MRHTASRSFRMSPTDSLSWAIDLFRAQSAPEQVELSGRPLWLYGRGELGEMAREFFRYVGVEVAGTFEYDGLAPRDVAQIAVCVVRGTRYGQIESRLVDRGFRHVAPFYDLAQSVRGDHPLENGWIASPTEEDYSGMADVLERWSDEASRTHYVQFLAWRILREEWVFGHHITKDNLFFIPEVASVLREGEVFLDGGAHHGETSRQFADLVPEFSEIVSVEPDDHNMAEMREKWATPYRRYMCDFALSDRDEESAPFAEGFGHCSKLTPSGRARKVTRRIDSLNIDPTFVKLHLEGGDLAALRGGAKTLAHCRPIVAVRIDHNSDGLWRTARHLMETLEDYHFILRNHCWCGSAAAIYAIPRERLR